MAALPENVEPYRGYPDDTQQAAIGAVLIEGAAAWEHVKRVPFQAWHPMLRPVVRACERLTADNAPIDAITVSHALDGALDPSFVTSLHERGRSVTHVAEYARMTWDAWRRGCSPGLTDEQRDAAFPSPFASDAMPWTWTEVGRWFLPGAHPPEPDFLFDNTISRAVKVGVIASQSGGSKTFVVHELSLSYATGQTILPTFKPARAGRVMALLGEDPPEEIWRRTEAIVEKHNLDVCAIAENLRLMCGQSAPLLELQDGNPRRTRAYEWLAAQCEEFKPDLLIIDPKAQFSGVDENSNDHATQFAQCLKDLAAAAEGTVLVTHHVTKAGSGENHQHSARGASAFVDACRWAAHLRPLPEKTAELYGVDGGGYIELAVTKNSYAPMLPRPVTFKRGPRGILIECDLHGDHLAGVAAALIDEVRSADTEFTAHDLERSPACKAIRERLDVDRKTLRAALDWAVERGQLTVRESGSGRTRKAVLCA